MILYAMMVVQHVNRVPLCVSHHNQVMDMKKKIEGIRADLAADLQRLVHAGKELRDEQTVSQSEIVADATIVVMMRKVFH